MKLKDKKHLKELGFKKVWLDDFSGFWYQKKIKHPYMDKVKIIIDNIGIGQVIIVEAKDFIDDTTTATANIYCELYSRKRLNKILKWLES